MPIPSRIHPSAAVAAVIIAFFLGSCGQDRSRPPNIDLNGHAIVWAGPASADRALRRDFDETAACLRRNILPTRRGYADVVVIDGLFRCNGILARGCAELEGRTIYMDREYLYTGVFSHEVIHWETGMGDGYHNSPLFRACLGPD